MDSFSIKSVTFGGFDKLDVVRYIDNLSKTSAGEKQGLEEENRELRDENRRLRDRTASLEDEAADLRAKLADITRERDQLRQRHE